MPSSKPVSPPPRSAKAAKPVVPPPQMPPSRVDPTKAAREARTKEILEAARRREEELTKAGYCF